MVRILLVSFGSEWHNDVWNVLAIESLVGDLEGYFGNNIQISTFRFYTEDDIDSMFSDNNLLDYHLIGCSVEIGTHKILDYFLIKLFQNGYSNNLVLGHLSMIFVAKWQNFCVRKIPMPMPVQAQGS